MIIKRGDTFQPDIAVTLSGSVQSLVGWSIASQIRTKQGKLVTAFTVANRNDSLGSFRLVPVTPESSWPLDELLWDIQYTDASGRVISTDTVTLQVTKDITL